MERQERWTPYLSGVPALKVSLLFLSGIGLAATTSAPPSPHILWMAGIGIVLFWIVAEWMSQRNPGWFTGVPASVGYFLLIVFAGWFVVQMQQIQDAKQARALEPLGLLAWEERVVFGVMEERTGQGETRERIRVRVRSTELTNPEKEHEDISSHLYSPLEWHQPYTLLLYRDGESDLVGLHTQGGESGRDGESDMGDVGDSLRVLVRFYPRPEQRNPHDFDTANWLLSQGIDAQGRLMEVLPVRSARSVSAGRAGWTESRAERSGGFLTRLQTSSRNGFVARFQASFRDGFGDGFLKRLPASLGDGFSLRFWSDIRRSVVERIDRLFPDPEESAMAKALFLGQKDALSGDTKTAFSRSGLSHVMAVSGLHVGFVVAPFWLLIPWIRSSTRKKTVGFLLLCALLLFYAGLTGFSASVMRASLMAVLLTFGRLFSRQGHSINLVCVVLLMLLIIRPSMLFEVGFQLSFSAVFIILLIMPVAQRWIPNRLRYSRAGPLISVMLVSAVVQVGLFPVLTAYFGEFSVIGPLANLVVVPLLSGLVPSGLLISVMPGLPEWLTTIPVMVMRPLLRWIPYAAETFGSTPVSFLQYSHQSVWLHLVWVTGVLMIASWRRYRIRWALLILLLGGIAILLFRSVLEGSGTRELAVTFLDVGQGDAVHIQTPEGRHLLIDTGPAMGGWGSGQNAGRDAGRDILVPYLEDLGVDTVDAIVLSHPHADHIGGTAAILNAFPVKHVFESPFPSESQMYRRYRAAAARLGVPVIPLEAGDRVDADPSIQIYVLSPYGEDVDGGNINNRSVVLRIDYGKTSFLFTGDAEWSLEQELAEAYGDFLDTDVLKAGHHGSNTSSSASFLNLITPDWTVVSCALKNRFRHPGQEAVQRIRETGSGMLFTSLSGAVQIRSDGERLHYDTVVPHMERSVDDGFRALQ